MSKEEIKKAYELAQKELKEKRIGQVKELVKKTLERLSHLDEQISKLQEERKILKLDIDDLKAGRLDRIEERQSKDEKAKKTSVATIVKEKVVEHHHHYDNYWYYPYRVVWNPPLLPYDGTVYCTTGNASTTIGGNAVSCNSINTGGCSSFTLTSSVAKDFSIGTYNIDGDIVHLR